MSQINFKELETRGFVKVPKFLTHSEINAVQNDYTTATPSANGHYSKTASADIIDLLIPKIENILLDIQNSTKLTTDILCIRGTYTNSKLNQYGLHQDHGHYFKTQQSDSCLIFYIIVDKPVMNKSGLDLMPYDTLEKCYPEFAQSVKNKGACRYQTSAKVTKMCDDTVGIIKMFHNVNLNAIKETPELSTGDLLIFKGDVIHAKQDSDKQRIALSVRCSQGSKLIKKTELMHGYDFKKDYIKNDADKFNPLLNYFNNNDVEEIVAKDHLELIEHIALPKLLHR
jgi:hypothetical protein